MQVKKKTRMVWKTTRWAKAGYMFLGALPFIMWNTATGPEQFVCFSLIKVLGIIFAVSVVTVPVVLACSSTRKNP